MRFLQCVVRPSSRHLRSQSNGREHCAREPEAEVPQRLPARDGLGQAFGQFIECVVHNLSFLLVWFLFCRFSYFARHALAAKKAAGMG
jgi:hypothetical protein